MVRISKDFHIHSFSVAAEPCLKVDTDTRLIFEAWDALEGNGGQKRDPSETREERLKRANPATGPLYVNGALPGDVLEVEIHEIIPTGRGYLNLKKDRVSYEKDSMGPIYTEFDYIEGSLIYNGVRLPAYPMVGVIGTAPKEAMWTQETGNHGGNMDTSLVKAGAVLLLPVFTEGALLAMGDVHAAMGDGEIFGQGVEIGADIEVTVRVRKDIKLKRPVILVDGSIACIGSGDDMEDTSYMVVQDMGNYLTQVHNLTWEEAGVLISFYGDLKICQLVNPQKTIRVELKSTYIDMIKRGGDHR